MVMEGFPGYNGLSAVVARGLLAFSLQVDRIITLLPEQLCQFVLADEVVLGKVI
jgi:hypothetical protein